MLQETAVSCDEKPDKSGHHLGPNIVSRKACLVSNQVEIGGMYGKQK
jgi:hypothetical protein